MWCNRFDINCVNIHRHHRTSRRINEELEPNTSDFRVDKQALMRWLGVHKIIPDSDTKPTLNHQVGFIISNLTADKLFPVNQRVITGPPKMSHLIEFKSTPALTIKPRFIVFVHMDVLGWHITFNLYCTTNCIPINLVFQENFPTNTQIWNSLRHRNDRRRMGVIRVTYGCYNSNPYYVRNISQQEVKIATKQLIATRDRRVVKGCNTRAIRGRWTQPLQMMANHITHVQTGKWQAHPEPLMLVNSIRSGLWERLNTWKFCLTPQTLKSSMLLQPN